MIPLKDQESLKKRFARDLTSRVRLDLFTQRPSPIYIPGRQECATCDDARKLLHELAALNLRISLTHHDIEDEPDAARQLGVDKVPGIVLRGQANRALRYFGMPISRQFATFVELTLMVARGVPAPQPETIRSLRRLRNEVGIKLFVTPGCMHSPQMVQTAARLALQSPRLTLDVIDVSQFPQLAPRYYVRVTPLIVLDDQYGIAGVLDEATLVQDLLEAAQGEQPARGGDPKKLTPVAPPQPQQRRRPSSSSGLILPR